MRKFPDIYLTRIHPGHEKCDRARRAPQMFSGAWVIGLALCLAGVANAQIAPGPLARAHQSLDGGANCMKCHEVSTRTPTFRCLECHKEIAAELQQHKGLHATFPRTASPGAACVQC